MVDLRNSSLEFESIHVYLFPALDGKILILWKVECKKYDIPLISR